MSVRASRLRASVETLIPDIATGIRAALATVIPFVLAARTGRHELASMALGGWLGTLADPGGSRPRRALSLVTFAILGGGALFVAESVAYSPWLVVVVVAAVAFAGSLLRSLGGGGASLGTLVAVTAAIAGTKTDSAPALDALYFGYGSAIALVLSTIVWPVWTHMPVRRALAAVYAELAAYARDVHACVRESPRAAVTTDEPDRLADRWTAIVRTRPRRVREAIEQARGVALAMRSRRSGESRWGSGLRVLLGLAESQFLVLVTLAEQLQSHRGDARDDLDTRDAAGLAEIAALYAATSEAVITRRVSHRFSSPPPTPKPERSVDTIERLRARLGADALASLRLSVEPDHADLYPVADEDKARPIAQSRFADTARTLLDSLQLDSPFFRHALRVAAAVAAASMVASAISPSHGSWVTVTTLAVLQPYPGATVRRAIERVIGTVLGSAVAALLMFVVRGPLLLGLAMFPLSVAAVVTRPRSYRLFTFFLTPAFVLLAMRHPGDGWTAVLRATDAILGGLVALVASLLIFPSWERGRLAEMRATMLIEVERYLGAVLGSLTGDVAKRAAVPSVRRAGAKAMGDAESSLERYLAEPIRTVVEAEQAMQVITHARRLTLALTALDTLARQLVATTISEARARALVDEATALLHGARSSWAPPAPGVAADSKTKAETDAQADAVIESAIERVLRLASLLGRELQS